MEIPAIALGLTTLTVVKTMMNLRSTLGAGDVTLAKNALLKHVSRLVLTPTMMEGKKLFRVNGGLQVPGPNGVMQVVARDGLGPPTAVDSTQVTVSSSCQIR
jgi:hypothetical protein